MKLAFKDKNLIKKSIYYAHNIGGEKRLQK